MEPVELRASVADLRSRLSDARSFLDIEGKEAELVELRREASAPDLWDDQDRARAVTSRLARHEQTIKHVNDFAASLDDVDVLLELAVDEADQASIDEVASELEHLRTEMALLERESLFFGEYDDNPAIVSIYAGAGGVDAQDWAEMLLRMHVSAISERSGSFKIRSRLEYHSKERKPGSSRRPCTIKGVNAYGWHSKTESRCPTGWCAFQSVRLASPPPHLICQRLDLIPVVDDSIEIEIDESDDLRVDTYRARPAPAASTSTPPTPRCRLTHEPTGIVVSCQAERSQMQNKARAMQLLAARLAERARQEQMETVAAIRGEQTEAGWGRQIRSYVLQPYQMVKDLRTEFEVGNIQGVLDGDIDGLIDSYLHWRRSERVDA